MACCLASTTKKMCLQNTSSKSVCICCVDSALYLLSLSQFRPAMKYLVELLASASTVGMLFVDFEMLVLFV